MLIAFIPYMNSCLRDLISLEIGPGRKLELYGTGIISCVPLPSVPENVPRDLCHWKRHFYEKERIFKP